LLAKALPEIASLCQEIPFSSVATLLAAWNADEMPPIYGTGFLVARKPEKLITGVTTLSSKWTHLSDTGEVWLKISAGHYSDDRVTTLDDETLTSAMIKDTKSILGIAKDPIENLLFRWENAFPQYNTGHIERIMKIDSMTAAIPTLSLAGASYHGIGIPACISDGIAAADKLSSALQ
jgi:oxygen-dependent protoporphyrinogen oxidase